jgi:hypothetical protein
MSNPGFQPRLRNLLPNQSINRKAPADKLTVEAGPYLLNWVDGFNFVYHFS